MPTSPQNESGVKSAPTHPPDPAPAAPPDDDSRLGGMGDAGPGEGASSSERLGELVDEIENLRRENAEFKDKYLRSLADFDNYRRRARRQMEESSDSVTETVVKGLLPVVDNLERTVEAAGAGTDADSLRRGVEMVLGQFRDVLAGLGVQKAAQAGDEFFDPAKHEVLEQVESEEEPDGKVVGTLRAGYVFRGRTLRPSLVRVVRRK